MFNIGDRVLFLNDEKKTIEVGTIATRTISHSGYINNIILTEKEQFAVEDCHLFEPSKEGKEKAEKHLAVYKEKLAEMKAIDKEASAKIDAIREKLLGKAEYKEFAKRLY